MAHRHGTHSAPPLLPHVAVTGARQNGVTDGLPMAAHVHLQCHSSILSPKQYHWEAEVRFLLLVRGLGMYVANSQLGQTTKAMQS